MKTRRNITIKGLVVQDSWADEPRVDTYIPDLMTKEMYKTNPHTLCHTEFEITLCVSELRFDPINLVERDKVFHGQKLKALEKKLADNHIEALEIEDEIRKLSSLENWSKKNDD